MSDALHLYWLVQFGDEGRTLIVDSGFGFEVLDVFE
jgi:hypothetical protein